MRQELAELSTCDEPIFKQSLLSPKQFKALAAAESIVIFKDLNFGTEKNKSNGG